MLKKIAVTGGLSCGKSSVCDIFKEIGAYVVSADKIVHQLMSPNTPLGNKLAHLLGEDIIVNNNFDRTAIANKVFNNPTLLQSLENLIHPFVLNEIERLYQEVKNDGHTKLFIAEIPLLFEIGVENDFDRIIAVVANPVNCYQRFKTATGKDIEEYNKRMARQLSPEEKAKRADYVIKNFGTKQDLYKEVTKLYKVLQQP